MNTDISIVDDNNQYMPSWHAFLPKKYKHDPEIIFVYDIFNSYVSGDEKFANIEVRFYKQIVDKYFRDASFSEKTHFLFFYYTLGGFIEKNTETRKSKAGNIITEEVSYAQKIGELVKREFEKGKLTAKTCSRIFKRFSCEKFDIRFTKFLLEPYVLTSLIDCTDPENKNYLTDDAIYRLYNEFDRFVEYNTSNKGSQRELKPTVEKFVEYLTRRTFVGVNDDNRLIAKMLLQYTNSQISFARALHIDNERKELNTPNSILPYHFTGTATYGKRSYSYELLDSDDPTNFILGKMCDCCSHLEGTGFGIMHASIVRPDMQNLVIRDKFGTIIAKSTLYVNQEERYALFNTVEVKESRDVDNYEQLYYVYMKAVKEFAKAYNDVYVDKKLKRINVGLEQNDLLDWIEAFSPIVSGDDLLLGIDFSRYNLNKRPYVPESSTYQCELWHD